MQLMKSLSREERAAIAGRPDKDGETALCAAVKVTGGLPFVEYLLDECGADVEQCGFVEDLDRYDDDFVAKGEVV